MNEVFIKSTLADEGTRPWESDSNADDNIMWERSRNLIQEIMEWVTNEPL